MSARKAVLFANYPGNCTGNVGLHLGPRHLTTNEYVHVVEESYDPATDRTRLGLAFGLSEAARELLGDRVAALQ